MDNQVIETLLNHVSVREYQNKDIDDKTLDLILQSACNGSTMGNMQLFSIVVTRDDEMKKKMAPYHFNQPMATNAPVILTFCADFHRFNRFCECRNANTNAYSNLQAYQWAVTDALIAAQNACVAAESLGIGFCWLGTITYNTDNFIEILQLPKHVIPVACITFGYPVKKMPLTQKLPYKKLIHNEVYTDYSDQNIDETYFEKENSDETKRIIAENPGMENLAQVFTECRYKENDNVHFSKLLAKTIQNQGFNLNIEE